MELEVCELEKGNFLDLAVAPYSYWTSWRVLALPGNCNNFGVGAGAGQGHEKGGERGARGSTALRAADWLWSRPGTLWPAIGLFDC